MPMNMLFLRLELGVCCYQQFLPKPMAVMDALDLIQGRRPFRVHFRGYQAFALGSLWFVALTNLLLEKCARTIALWQVKLKRLVRSNSSLRLSSIPKDPCKL